MDCTIFIGDVSNAPLQPLRPIPRLARYDNVNREERATVLLGRMSAASHRRQAHLTQRQVLAKKLGDKHRDFCPIYTNSLVLVGLRKTAFDATVIGENPMQAALDAKAQMLLAKREALSQSVLQSRMNRASAKRQALLLQTKAQAQAMSKLPGHPVHPPPPPSVSAAPLILCGLSQAAFQPTKIGQSWMLRMESDLINRQQKRLHLPTTLANAQWAATLRRQSSQLIQGATHRFGGISWTVGESAGSSVTPRPASLYARRPLGGGRSLSSKPWSLRCQEATLRRAAILESKQMTANTMARSGETGSFNELLPASSLSEGGGGMVLVGVKDCKFSPSKLGNAVQAHLEQASYDMTRKRDTLSLTELTLKQAEAEERRCLMLEAKSAVAGRLASPVNVKSRRIQAFEPQAMEAIY